MAQEQEPIPDEWLVAAAREDPQAFSQLYRRHYDQVFRHCVHRLFDRTAAEDVTASVFLRAVRNLRQFQGNGRDFRGWLFRITTNAVNDHLRRSRRQKRLLEGLARSAEGAAGKVPEAQRRSADLHDERMEAVRRVILRLRPEYQTVISLRFFDALSPTEMAEVLGISPATVRSQLSRALGAMREAMVERGMLTPQESHDGQ